MAAQSRLNNPDSRLMQFRNRTQAPALRNRSNVAPVAKLPIETISEIFRLVQAGGRNSNIWFWIAITHVCRSWRNIALGTQDLWTFIDTAKHASLEQTAAYLERSGTSQLVVHHTVGIIVFYQEDVVRRAEPRLLLALGHLRRIRELEIIPSDSGFSAELTHVLRVNSAPVLRKFHLGGGTFDPRTIFNNHTPNLRDLDFLCLTPPSWTSIPIMRNLTELSFGNPDKVMTLQDILIALAQSPRMENFHCHGAEVDQSTEIRLPVPIRLPHLKDITIRFATHGVISQLLQNVMLPNRMGWEIYCTEMDMNNDSEDPRAIIPCLSNTNEICSSLVLSISNINMQICSDHGDVKEQWEKRGPLRRSITYEWTKEGEDDEEYELDIAEVFRLICSIINNSFWCSATRLKVEIDADISRDEDLFTAEGLQGPGWARLLLLFPSLQMLSVRRCKALERPEYILTDSQLGLITALKGAIKDRNGVTRCICPRLMDLQLCGINFGTALRVLDYVLNFRKANGCRLRTLEFCEPVGLTADIMREMQRRGFAHMIKITKEQKLIDHDDEDPYYWSDEMDVDD